jgi:hypothetical protein
MLTALVAPLGGLLGSAQLQGSLLIKQTAPVVQQLFRLLRLQGQTALRTLHMQGRVIGLLTAGA